MAFASSLTQLRRTRYKRAAANSRFDKPAQWICSVWPHVPVAGEMDGFDRYQFITKTIEGDVNEQTVNNAIVAGMGFRWSDETNSWSNAAVSQANLELCGRISKTFPPNFLNDGVANGMLERQLPQAEDIQKGLAEYVENHFGEEYTKHCRDSGDVDFFRREVVAKWLHMFADF
eukprot:Plantae.Rhodophyta-Purpureofilum_apyrenoidigerum.ctg62773.p2 GENE.Plantae.Rhodophyta-Purpureofilum_apyrenoidigerum.ctg62773~~Plantae.Rhodophyta-Purpureofilum_apyrenoidigerum.ctg62773.p2  ORF type:complete len:174 (-),score=24.34 Plantae.Rhodophyta-Purpureofilum_apyrenoidigerum.ctg62773:123-644(-)